MKTAQPKFKRLVQKILNTQPDNLAALLELSRIAAKRGDAATLKSAVAKISARSSAWPPEVQHQLAAVQSAAAGADLRPAATQTTFLRNVIMRVPEYRSESDAPSKPRPAMRPSLSPTSYGWSRRSSGRRRRTHRSLRHSTRSRSDEDRLREIGVGSVRFRWVARALRPSPWRMAAKCACPAARRCPSPAGRRRCAVPEGVMPVDFNYDFKTDLVLAGAGGRASVAAGQPKRIHGCNGTEQTAEVVINARYTGAWAVDIEADGDLDIVLGAKDGRADGPEK